MDRAMQREPGPPLMSPYGDFDAVISTIAGQLEARPYLLGETICAADILWGTALSWGFRSGIVPKLTAIERYFERVMERRSAVRAAEIDEELAARLAKAPA